MRIKCKKKTLLGGINIVSKAVSAKVVKSILECFLLEAKDGKLKITANNLNLGIETYIDCWLSQYSKSIVTNDITVTESATIQYSDVYSSYTNVEE